MLKVFLFSGVKANNHTAIFFDGKPIKIYELRLENSGIHVQMLTVIDINSMLGYFVIHLVIP